MMSPTAVRVARISGTGVGVDERIGLGVGEGIGVGVVVGVVVGKRVCERTGEGESSDAAEETSEKWSGEDVVCGLESGLIFPAEVPDPSISRKFPPKNAAARKAADPKTIRRIFA